MDLSDLYSEYVLAIAANAAPRPRLAAPDVTARKVSPLCGSTIEIDLIVTDGVVVAYGHDARQCALGQTSTAIVAARIVGTKASELRDLRHTVEAMLKQGAPPPSGRWSDLAYLAPVRDYPARHGSTLLVFDAIVAGLDALDAQRAGRGPDGEGGLR